MRRLIGLVAGFVVGLASLVALGAVGTTAAYAKDVDCSDFSTQAAAQHYFINHGGPNSDPDGLDSDGDGIACESNPCPCTTSTGGGGGGGEPGGNKRKHALNVKVKREGPARKLLLTGKVTTFKGGQIQVFRKAASKGFRLYKRAKASPRTGAFSRPLAYIGFEKTCFRVVVPETKKYLKTVRFVGCFVKSA